MYLFPPESLRASVAAGQARRSNPVKTLRGRSWVEMREALRKKASEFKSVEADSKGYGGVRSRRADAPRRILDRSHVLRERSLLNT